ncbi:hypothetical protein CKO51_24855 [Rhodopirellula sp. SM50]|nr:hypothetical protein CKO51_24855 [Rhodopirellula sp. SM50]
MPGDPQQVQTIFGEAVQKPEPERAEFLERACGGDSDLRRRVEALIEAHEHSGSFLDSPPKDLAGTNPTIAHSMPEQAGSLIGPFKLLQQIGEGGMGSVYMAEQIEPVERRVALKIIKPGMDTKAVIARFEAERQALAMMDHPGIAKVLDVGTTNSGRPYFVMELVRGVPITQYCDEHHLTPRQRLELFLPVCHAVQHAHQKGIIHRDIKPSNVLVAEYDDKPVPKIIDFGLAKAMEKRLTTKTMFTEFGQVVGTPDYMSPEQAKLNQMDIDTRSDIYSLGVLLYELLSGNTPFDRQRMRSAAFDELLRIIREEEPPKPSQRLSTVDTLPSIAANRHITPAELTRQLSGELDWIVMKTLEKDRSRRYDTANGLANDVQRYLNDEPVLACPPSAAYRFRKFTRRHRRVALTAGLLVGTLLIGLLTSGWQALRASRQRDRAVHAEAIAGRRLIAEQAARSDAETARGAAIDARTDAESAANQHRQALVRQYVRQGTEYVGKGDHTTALPWFLKALEIDRDDPNREFIHRMRIAATIERCPKLASNWKSDRVVERIEFFADGNRVLLRGKRGPPSIWSLDGSKSDFSLDVGRFATLNSDGTQIVICTKAGAVVVADTDSGAVKVKLEEDLGRPVFAGFGPQGDRVFVVYGNRRVRVWNTDSGEAVTPVLNDCTGEIVEATFNTSGRYLIAAEDQPSVPDSLTVWDLNSPGKAMHIPISSLTGDQGYSLAAGANMIAVPNDVFVAVVSLETGKQLYPRLAHADAVQTVRLSTNGKLLLSCGRDHAARIWDIASGEPVTDWLRHDAPIRVAEFSSDDSRVVTASQDGEISVWSVETGQRTLPRIRHPDSVHAARFTPDGQRLLTSSADGVRRVWDLAAARPAPSLVRKVGNWFATECDFVKGVNSQDSLFVAQPGRRLLTYDLKSKSIVGQPITRPSNTVFAMLHQDSKSIVTASYNGRLARLRMSDGGVVFQRDDFHISPGSLENEPYRSIDEAGRPYHETRTGAVMDPAGKWFVAHANYPGPNVKHSKLLAIDATTGESLSEMLSFDAPMNQAVVTTDGKFWVGGFGRVYWDYRGCRVEIRSLPEMNLVRTIPFEETIRAVCVSADNKRIVVGGGRADRPGFAQVFDFETGKALTPRVAHPGYVEDTRLLAGESHVLSTSRDGTLRFWDVRNGRQVAPEIRLGRPVRALAVDPHQRWLATGTATNNANGQAEQYLRLWDIQTGEPISPPYPHADGIFRIAVSDDAMQIATASRDGHVRVFDVPRESRSVEELRRLSGICAGITLDGRDNEVVVDAAIIEESWKELSAKYPGQFRVSAEERNAWFRHRFEVEFNSGNLAAALEVLNRLLEIDAQDPELYRRRIALKKRLERYESIPQDAETLQRIMPHDTTSLATLAWSVAVESADASALNDYALGLADRAVAMSPDNAQTRRYRALVRRRSRKIDGAVSDLEKAIELQAGNYRHWYELALLKLSQGDRDEYDQICRDMVQTVPPSSSLVIEEFVSWTCSLGGADMADWGSIVARAKFAADAAPAAMQYRKALGAAYLRAGHLGEAYRELIEADRLLNDPSNAMLSSPAYTWYLLAITCKRTGFEEEAQSWYQKAREWFVDQQDKPAVVWNRQRTLELLDAEASTLFRDEVAWNDADPHAWLGRAAVLEHRGDANAAEQAINRAVEFSENDGTPLLVRARRHLTAGRDREAERDLLEAVRRGIRSTIRLPELAEFLRRRGEAHFEMGQFEKAISDYDVAIRLNPQDSMLFKRRGEAYRALGKHETAMADFEVAIRLAPNIHHLLNARANTHLRLKQYDRAIADYNEAIRLAPTVAWVHQNRAKAYFFLGDYEKAIVGLDEAIRLGAPDHWANYFRAEAHLQLKNYDQAIEDYRRVVEIRPTDRAVWLRLLDLEHSRNASEETIMALVAEVEAGVGGLGYLYQAAWYLLHDRRVEYERICHEAAAKFADSTDPRELLKVARAAALSRDPVLDTKQIVAMARPDPDAKLTSWAQHFLGLCLLRDGQSGEAIECFSSSLKSTWDGAPCNLPALAIAHSAAGQPDQAKEWLQKSQQWSKEDPLDMRSELQPIARMTFQLLLREAEQRIDGAVSDPKPV